MQADYLIVGAGSAGAAIAARLSENGKFRVLLLEAGGPLHPFSHVPVSYAYFMNKPGTNWLYKSEPEPSTGLRRISVPRGRMLGGSSAINGNAWVRGNPKDFDHWRQLGNTGWGYDDVLPFFGKLENFEGGDAELRGRAGPVRISQVSPPAAMRRLYESFFLAAESIGLHRNDDYNGARQDGVGMTQGAVSGSGRRMSTAECYLKPARGRANLHIRTGVTAERLIFRDGHCIGVTVTSQAGRHDILASREVIVSAGVIGSPKLLELSGIGQASRLGDLGIAVMRDVPGVGENLTDHWAPRLKWRVGRHGVTYNERAGGPVGKITQGLEYFLRGRGLLAIPPGALRGFFKTDSRMDIPDAIFMLTPFLVTPTGGLAADPGIYLVTHQLRPESRGSVHVVSNDAAKDPSIRFNFLSDATDRDCILSAIRTVRRIVEAPALKWLDPVEMEPSAGARSDEALLDYVAGNAETTYHPVGTCKMGSDRMAVVDDQLRVRGVSGLRVADASIMPTIVSGNTNAASIMIGEKAASLLLG